MDRLERELAALGYARVAGIDEAGRGPLAGPVVAAAVVLPRGLVPEGVNDSKKLGAAERERLYDVIHRVAVGVGVARREPEEIDRTNILRATLAAMLEAAKRIEPAPDYLLIDGNQRLLTWIPQRAVVRGDSLSISMAAASIVAKVTRDRLMTELAREYPGYGFARHKGYGTRSHLEAISRLGPCPAHRRTFRGVRERF